MAVRWYLRYGLSYRDVEELLAERDITVDHVTVYRWVQRFTPEFIEAARLCRRAPGDRWFVDETYVRVAGRWTYLYRAIDQHGQVIDVLLSVRRDLAAARRFFIRALRAGTVPAEVTTDRAPAYPRVLDELIPSALHTVERYANNPVETDHGRLKARLRPMRGIKRHRSARILATGHAFAQNLRRGHYELATRRRRPPPAPRRLRPARDGHLISPSSRSVRYAHAHRSANATLPAGQPPGSRTIPWLVVAFCRRQADQQPRAPSCPAWSSEAGPWYQQGYGEPPRVSGVTAGGGSPAENSVLAEPVLTVTPGRCWPALRTASDLSRRHGPIRKWQDARLRRLSGVLRPQMTNVAAGGG